jgi:hypothetical protein
MLRDLDAKGYLPSPLSEPALTRLVDLLGALLARHHDGTAPFRPGDLPATGPPWRSAAHPFENLSY